MAMQQMVLPFVGRDFEPGFLDEIPLSYVPESCRKQILAQLEDPEGYREFRYNGIPVRTDI
jgi:hypothetical protein